MAVVRTAGFRVRPESQTQGEAAVAAFVAAVRAGEPGTRLIVALHDVAEPTRFTLLLVFDDNEAEDVHNRAEWSKALGTGLAGHLAGPFSYIEYAEVPGTESIAAKLPSPGG